jgi:hypothetical protein
MLPQFAAVFYDRIGVVTCVVVIFRDDHYVYFSET